MNRRTTVAAVLAAGLSLTACGAGGDEEAQEEIEELEEELAEAEERIDQLMDELLLADRADEDGTDADDEFNGMADDEPDAGEPDEPERAGEAVDGVDAGDVDDAHRVPETMIEMGFPLPEGAMVHSGTDDDDRWSITFEHEADAMDGVLGLYRPVIEEEHEFSVALDDDVEVDGERRLSWTWDRDTFEYETDDGMELESERYRMSLRGDEQSDGASLWRLTWQDMQQTRESLGD